MWKFVALLLAVIPIHAWSQVTPAETPIDWTKLDPQLIELAFDDIDAVDRAADALSKPDSIFVPIHEESKKIEQEMRRYLESDADWRIYGDIVDFSFGVSMCRARYDEARCNTNALVAIRDRATKDLKADRLLYLAAVKHKP